MDLITNDAAGELTTTTTIINRIPDVLNAKSGFITVSDLDSTYFKAKNLGEYVKN